MRVSLVIAAHNEAETIGAVVEAAREVLGHTLIEAIVVDDGSTDGTLEAAERAGAHCYRLSPNRGKGSALRTGISASTGEWLVFIDADGQDDPREIPLLLAEAKGDTVMVNGSRFLGRLEDGAISRPNYVGNRALTGVFNVLFGTRITDTQAGFRAIRGDVARHLALHATEYEIETEMLAHVLRRGYRVVEVPVTRYPRKAGVTDFKRIRNGLRILGTILSERAR